MFPKWFSQSKNVLWNFTIQDLKNSMFLNFILEFKESFKIVIFLMNFEIVKMFSKGLPFLAEEI